MSTPFRIEPKRDFGNGPGWWLPNAGEYGTEQFGFVKHGFVVTDGLCNIMPAAIWFRTVADASRALGIYCAVHGDESKFWHAFDIMARGLDGISDSRDT